MLRHPALFAAAILGAAIAASGEPSSAHGERGSLNAGLVALVSYQPEGYDGTGGPYLDNSLGGVEPGLALTFEGFVARRWLLAAELSSTTSLEAVQSGRFVVGGGPALATHRDTLVSLLSGAQIPVGDGAVEVKGGASLALGTPKQGDVPANGDSGRFALTVGLDGVVPLTPKLDLVPSLRYSHVWRGENALFVGLGDHIFRAGVGVRVWLSQ
jgi:hypothetical protein